jgi:hypothetical protein
MNPLTSQEAAALETICKGIQNSRLGARLKDAVERIVVNENNSLVELTFEITTGAATIQTVSVPFDIEVLDVIIQPRGASTNGTMKLSNGTNDISNAMVTAVDKTMVRAGTIDNAYSLISSGGTLGIICAGDVVASTVGLITILARRT